VELASVTIVDTVATLGSTSSRMRMASSARQARVTPRRAATTALAKL
jgi:hypothetical protein